MNNDLDRQLSIALARQEAPEGFADRVLAAARTRRNRMRSWLAAASLLAVLLPSGYAYHLHTERQRAEAQLRLALEVASEKLNLAFKRLNSDSE